jgi:hemerythrin superfamily protein
MPPATAANSTEIRNLFLADHRRLDALLEQLIAAFEANDREDVQALWTLFDKGLLAHLEAEENVLIPSLRSTNPTEADALLREHDHFRDRLAELGAGIDLHIVRLETARAFASELLKHADREDQILYRWTDVRTENHPAH